VTLPLWAVLPGSIDDPAAPSGGNRYDRTVLTLLAAARAVHEVAIGGAWPSPDAAAREALAKTLGDIPDKSDVLLDGLVACGVPEVLAPHARRLRLAILVHLPLSDETGLDAAAAAALRARERAALHLASVVIATSEAAAARISGMHDLSGVVVAEPGVDPAAVAPPTATGHRLLCVASVTPRKGQDLLVTALERDLADLRWACTFVGALVRPVPHTSAGIRFVGPKAGGDLDAAYADADLFVLPSRAETYGMVVTEALARGLPVLATDVGGVSEALGLAPDGTRPGLLIPADDPPALAGALRAWLTDPSLRESLRTAARARRRTLPAWTETARRLSDALEG
jgi:glycosyltransferase involved in cell wall biosynthesis